MKRPFLSSVILLVSAMFWGFSFVSQILGADYIETFSFNGLRFLLGALVLVPIILFFEKDKPTKSQWKQIGTASVVTGSLVFAAAALQQFGCEQLGDPGKAGFITGLYTVLTPIFYFLFFRKKTNALTWIGAVIAVIGLYFLCVGGNERFTFGVPELLVFLSAIFWAFHIIAIDRFVGSVSPLKFTCGQFLVCSALNLFVSLFCEHTTFQGIYLALDAIVYCGVFAVGLGFTGQVIGLKLTDNPTRAAIVMSTESLFSMVFGVLWNLIPGVRKVNSSFSLFGILGAVLIFTAIVLEQLPVKAKKQEETVPEK